MKVVVRALILGLILAALAVSPWLRSIAAFAAVVAVFLFVVVAIGNDQLQMMKDDPRYCQGRGVTALHQLLVDDMGRQGRVPVYKFQPSEPGSDVPGSYQRELVPISRQWVAHRLFLMDRYMTSWRWEFTAPGRKTILEDWRRGELPSEEFLEQCVLETWRSISRQ